VTITAVIPTRGTETCVIDAANSALCQTRPVDEIIVVADGYCRPDIADALVSKGVRLEILSERRGANAARQRGVELAVSEFIAFLDDDDLWMKEKIEKQFDLLSNCRPSEIPVLYTAVSARRGTRVVTRPTRFPAPGQRIQDYLFVRKDFNPGSAFLSTSTLATRREFLIKRPFDSALTRHQDWDWLIRSEVAYRGRLAVQVHPAPLTRIRLDHAHGISASTDWRSSFRWVQGIRSELSPREYADLLMVVSGSIAGRSGSGRGLLTIAWEAFRLGNPSWRGVLTLCAFALSPKALRRWFTSFRPR
jgi:glycosyltransferase involved in cell wall biosynthesis